MAHACGPLDQDLWARCLDAYERRHGPTVAMLESRARLALARGRPSEAMAVFAGSPGPWPVWQWELGRVKILEAAGDASAGNAWEDLADAHADNHAIQRHALAAASTRDNAPLHDRLIRRIRAATGSRGIVWRLAQARQCLRGSPSDPDLAAAVTLLHQVIECNPDAADAQHLLAHCLTLLGRTEEARQRQELATRSSPHPSRSAP
jgi:thioredoxin-like negative regulator of GroEL